MFMALIQGSYAQVADSTIKRYGNREIDHLWLDYEFDKIIEEYTLRIAEDSTDADALYHIGAAYVSSHKNIEQAQVHYEKVLELEKQGDINEFFYFLGRIYHLNHNYFFALAAYSSYMFDLPEDKQNQESKAEIEELISKAENGTDLIETDSTVFNRFVTFSKHKVLYFTESNKFIEINNLGGEVNSAFSEYGPVIFSEEKMLIFTSRRPNKTSHDMYFDGQPYEDIYSAKDNNGYWHDIQPIDGMDFFNGELVNYADHEATVSLSKNEKTLIISRQNTVMLMHRDTILGAWSPLQKMNKVVHQRLPYVNGASVSNDGNLLIISATNPDAIKENLDLYAVRKDTLGKWSHFTNIGAPINTEFNETSPYIFNDSTLFFSSNSEASIGEYDVFISYLYDGVWTTPENLGVPINSAYNEVNYSVDNSNKYAFLASDRPNGYGKYDIYRVSNGITLRNTYKGHDRLASSNKMQNQPFDKLGLSSEVVIDLKKLQDSMNVAMAALEAAKLLEANSDELAVVSGNEESNENKNDDSPIGSSSSSGSMSSGTNASGVKAGAAAAGGVLAGAAVAGSSDNDGSNVSNNTTASSSSSETETAENTGTAIASNASSGSNSNNNNKTGYGSSETTSTDNAPNFSSADAMTAFEFFTADEPLSDG